MDYMHLIYVFSIYLILSSVLIKSQQPYIRKASTLFDSTDNSTSVLGYTYNGITLSCQASLSFRSQPPFTSVSSISSLLAADPSQLSRLNSVPEDATFEPNKMVLVPVNCSCSASPPPPPLSSVPSSKNSSNKTWIYVVAGVLGGLTLLSVIGAIIFCIFFRRNKKKLDPILASENFEAEACEKPTEKLEEESDLFDSISSIAQSLKIYTIEELQSATDNFSPNCWIKGSVYGTINGDFAAIKRINGDVSKEISLLNKINHFNLIRLSGICFNDGNWYLVYDYVVNGPLSDWIYNNSGNQKFLTWTQRIQIALDVATGLDYFHCYASPPYVHKDLKSSNVLLDSDYKATIANFNLARSADGEEGQFVLTRHILGTKGYMAPEYLENGLISTKLDVYSFGVLMLELLTGKEVALLYEGVNTDLSN